MLIHSRSNISFNNQIDHHVQIGGSGIGVLHHFTCITLFGYIWRPVSAAGGTHCSWEWTSSIPLATATTSHGIRTRTTAESSFKAGRLNHSSAEARHVDVTADIVLLKNIYISVSSIWCGWETISKHLLRDGPIIGKLFLVCLFFKMYFIIFREYICLSY